jgi:O-antigen ligase
MGGRCLDHSYRGFATPMTILRIGICLLVVFAVTANGAVEPWSEAILEIAAAVLFVWWGFLVARHKTGEISWSPVFWPILAIFLFGLLQYIVPLSVYPYLTKLELLRWTTYLLVIFLSGQAFQTPRHWGRFTWFLVWFGFAVAVFGILQDLTSNGKLYWFRELRFGGAMYGPFVNKNHFAGFMELVIPVGLATLAMRGVRRQQIPLIAFCTVLPIGALILSASRAGVVAFGGSLIILILLLLFRHGEKRNLLVFLAVLVFAGGLVAWMGADRVIARFEQIRNPEISESRRISMMRGALHMFRANPWIGTGLGTTISVYPRFETHYDGNTVDHVHNDHLELLAETGIIGGVCWLAFIGILVRAGLKNLSSRNDALVQALQIGALVGCASLLIHGLVDFNLHIPSNALLFFLLAQFAASGPVSGPAN